ncbi:TetR/AcrR family transcriptional regulator [Pedobacter sp.]|uniref:TetR/AcrR family transcriptional regulator n=1 Tax=Pedobacter sp. TaxID=1411316 RepID=UPI003D7FC61C
MNIIQKSFDLIYERGYQSTSIDDIIATTQMTKGAFFYHFKNKEEMGLAVINEMLYPHMIPFLDKHLARSGDARANIYRMMEVLLLEDTFFKVEFGCPMVNLIEEMAPHNPSFRRALIRVISLWQSEVETAIINAQAEGLMSKSHNAKNVAQYISANYGGARYMGKLYGKAVYTTFLNEFKKYLDGLK